MSAGLDDPRVPALAGTSAVVPPAVDEPAVVDPDVDDGAVVDPNVDQPAVDTEDERPADGPDDGPLPHPGPRGHTRRRRADPTAVLLPAAVALATLVLRLITAAAGPTDWDSAQYTLAVGRFDVTHGLPQPPGYWLYVTVGGWVARLFGTGHVRGLVVVAALASAAAAGATVVAGTALGGRWLGLAAGVVVATSPFAWFSGSVVATYSFDALAGAVLVVLAWRARPGSWHGVAAVATLTLLAGFRPSMVQAFALLALVAVVGATRSWGRLVATVLAGAAAWAVWFLPMVAAQPGGFHAWARATRSETDGAFSATSVLDHAAGGRTNLGTFAAYTVVALAPVAVVAVVTGVALVVRRLVRGPTAPARARTGDRDPADPWHRPWYQSRAAVLAAATVPPAAIVALVEFAKGGYLLAYLPGAVIALLLPAAALTRPALRRGDGARRPRRRRSPVGVLAATVLVAAVAVLGTQRFVSGTGVLPQGQLHAAGGGLWLDQARYQAPYPDTRAAITGADTVDAALVGLRTVVDPARDVVVFDTLDGGANIYRNAGWAMPGVRSALIQPGTVLYNQLHGSLYYATGQRAVDAAPGGSVLLVASPALPGLATLTAEGAAFPVDTPRDIGGYRVWRLLPGTSVLGVATGTRAGPRPLGTGI